MNAVLSEPARPASLAAVGRGLADPVHGAQQVFRAVLEAMARPGRLQQLPADTLAGLEPPAFGTGLGAVLLALLDAETGVWLDPALAGGATGDWLRFHTGVRLLDGRGEAPFAVVPAARADARLWSTLPRGSDEMPQHGATLVVDVPRLAPDGPDALALRGPGIADVQRLAVGGLGAAFWRARAALQPQFPCGIDLILVCGDTLAALPRTTRIADPVER